MSYDSLLYSFQKICVLVTFAYVLSRMGFFRRLFEPNADRRDRIWVFAFFGLLALIDLLLSPIESPAGSRVIAVTVAGLLGGPVVGIGVAMLVMVTGYFALGTEAAYSGFAAMVGGVLGGYIAEFRPHLQLRVLAGFIVGALSHTVWMGIVFSPDTLEATWDAAALMYGPPIILSGAGVALFLMIIGDMRAQQERIERMELARALNIGNSVLPRLKYGLNEKSAGYIAEIIRRLTGVSSVTITDSDEVLASTDGQGKSISKPAIRAIEEGSPVSFADGKSSWYAAPLFYDEQVIGCVELCRREGKIRPEVAELGREAAQFLSNYQLQLHALDRQSEAASKAELRALQAQVHPHFLFNTLNTLACLCETEPRKAGDIAIRLGAYFRSSLRKNGNLLIPLREELDNIRHYLEIEQARFRDRLSVVEAIEDASADALVPALSIQPLVENAVLHGLSMKPEKGNLRIVVRPRKSRLSCLVIDDGIGMAEDRKVADDEEPHGLTILRSRLDRIYHGDFKLRVRSRPGKGTLVSLSIPLERSID